MPILEISNDTMDKLFVDMLHEVAAVQVQAICLARSSLLRSPETSYIPLVDIGDSLEVLGAANRLLEYYGETPADLVTSLKEALLDVP